MPVEATFGRKWTYRAYSAEGGELAVEDFGSDDEAIAWVRRLLKESGFSGGRLSRDLVAGVGIDVPLP